MIQQYFLLVSKKNWKSGLAAAIMVTALVNNWRESAEFLIIAPTIEVAGNSFKAARDSVQKDPVLSTLIQLQAHTRTLTHRITGATLKIVAADSRTVTGKIATGVLVEELHEFGTMNDADNMLLEATGGLMSRPEGFTIYISTQSHEPPAGLFASKLAYARDVRDGKIVDNNFLPVIYEYPKSYIDDKLYLKPENFYITNPNLGASVDIKTIEGLHREATHKGVVDENLFASKHLNVEIGLNLLAGRWSGADMWQETEVDKFSLEQFIERCSVIGVGIDGGGRDDLLGFYAIGVEKITGRWVGWGHAWVMEIGLERRKSEASRMQDFANDGDLTIVPGDDGRDIDQLADIIKKIFDSGKLYHGQYDERGRFTETPSIGVDPIGLGMILTVLANKGIPSELIVAVKQGYTMMPQIKTMERKLLEGQFIHGESRLMDWVLGNAMVVPSGNAIMITKQASGFAKIDPLMALFDAAAIMVLNPVAQDSNYDDALRNPIIV